MPMNGGEQASDVRPPATGAGSDQPVTVHRQQPCRAHDPNFPGFVLSNADYGRQWEFGRPVQPPKPVSLHSKEAAVRAGPNGASTVLVNRADKAVGQPGGRGVVLEMAVLISHQAAAFRAD